MSLISRAARRHRRKDAEELNITAFMNLMVVLVPFLLITAVFSRLTVLQLNLPSSSQPTTETPQVLNLEVIVRKDGLQVADRGTGLLRSLPLTATGQDLKGLADFLRDQVKPRFPEATAVTVLLEPDIPYDTVIQVMDAVRVETRVEGGKVVQVDLFPDISIGDAPT